MKIINLGSMNIDYTYRVRHIVREGETIPTESRSVFPGGKGLNQSIALARAGVPVFHAGCVGKEDGDFLVTFLRENGVNTDKIKYCDGASGHAIIQVDDNGQNGIFLFPGANRKLTSADIDSMLDDAQPGDWLLLQNETSCCSEIIGKASERGMKVFFNIAPFTESILDTPLEKVDCLIMNETEAAGITGKDDPGDVSGMMEILPQKYPRADLLLTLGESGSVLLSRGKRIIEPAIPTEVMDTTGAGDTFIGYYLYALANHFTKEEALRLATKASSCMISKKGAAPSIPWLSELR